MKMTTTVRINREKTDKIRWDNLTRGIFYRTGMTTTVRHNREKTDICSNLTRG